MAVAATCPSGFNDVTNDYPATFYSKNDGFCPSGYEPYTAPSTLSFKFTGMVIDNAPDLCGDGSHYVNGECVAYATENCPSGSYKNEGGSATFYGKSGNFCPNGYEPYTAPSTLSFIFNGLILDNAPTVCATGHYVNGTCSAYSSTGCITGYVDAGTDSVVAAVDANGSCPSNYDSLWAYQSCNASTTESVCTTLCNGGMLKTDAGYCSAVCGAGLTRLKTSTGLSFNVYGTRTTTPSIVIGYDNGECYVNLSAGSATNAINVKQNNTTYHTTN